MQPLIKAFLCSLSLASILPFSQVHAQVPTATETPEAGYLFITGWYKDAAVQKTYIEKVGPVLKKHGFVTAKIGVPGLTSKVLEGDWTPRGLSLLQFESEKAVKQFWHSPEYQNNVKPIRHENSALDVIKLGTAFGTKPIMDNKSALLVFFVDITDREKLMNEYVPKAPAIVAKFGGKFLVSAARWNMELLEGDFPSESIVIVEFPSSDDLTAFWNDKKYKELSKIRKATGKWSVVQVTNFPG